MGLQYLIIGCFFLLNPYFSIIDILPDFIGCIFLMKGLSKVAKISESFSDAYRQFRNLLLLTLARIFTIPLISDTEEVWPLVIVLCCGLGEAYFTIRGFRGIFDGLSYTAHSPESALYGRWRELGQFTTFFLVARQVLCILPELCLLSSSEYGVVTPDGVQSLANYRLIFNLMAMVVGLLLGIAWFVQIRGYLKRIMKDAPYQSHLQQLYMERYTHVSAVYISSNLHSIVTLFMVAVVLSLELIFDGVNYLPHFVGAVFFIIAAHKLSALPGAEISSAKKTLRYALIYGIISLPRFVYSIIFTQRIFGEYLESEVEGLQLPYAMVLQEYLARDFSTIYGFTAQILLTAVEAVCFVLLLTAFYQTIKGIIRNHTRVSIPAPAVPEGLEDIPRPQDEFVVSVNRWLPTSRMLGVIAAVSMVIATAAPAFFPSYWLIDVLLRAAWVFSGYYLLSKTRDEINSHYSLVTREDIHELTH